MKKLNPNIRPPAGFSFEDSEGMRFEWDDFPSLVKSVIEYRVRTNRPPGNPEREIVDQICSKSPGLCSEVADPVATPGVATMVLVAQVTARMREWYREMRQGRLHFTDTSNVPSRVDACRQCPLNVDWSKTCPPCHSKASKVFPLIVSPAKPIKELKGRACLNAGDDLSVAVFMTEGQLVEGAPDYCWRKK